jgi:hypothetical protein
MGAFFTNVPVHIGNRLSNDVRFTIVAALRRLVSSDTFVEVSPANLTTERVMVVGPVGAGPWIAVYNSAIEAQDEAQRCEPPRHRIRPIPIRRDHLCLHSTSYTTPFAQPPA